MEELKKYNAWYAADTDEKKIYLTFDAGYDKEKNKTVDVFLFHGNLRESGVINMFMNTKKKI